MSENKIDMFLISQNDIKKCEKIISGCNNSNIDFHVYNLSPSTESEIFIYENITTHYIPDGFDSSAPFGYYLTSVYNNIIKGETDNRFKVMLWTDLYDIDDVSKFIDYVYNVVSMMDVMDYPVWCSLSTADSNLILSQYKFNPVFSINLDSSRPKKENVKFDSVICASDVDPYFMIFDMSVIGNCEKYYLDESLPVNLSISDFFLRITNDYPVFANNEIHLSLKGEDEVIVTKTHSHGVVTSIINHITPKVYKEKFIEFKNRYTNNKPKQFTIEDFFEYVLDKCYEKVSVSV